MANDKNNIPGARNMLRNAITRLSMHRRVWLNDPDCLLLRDSTGLTLHEANQCSLTLIFEIALTRTAVLTLRELFCQLACKRVPSFTC